MKQFLIKMHVVETNNVAGLWTHISVRWMPALYLNVSSKAPAVAVWYRLRDIKTLIKTYTINFSDSELSFSRNSPIFMRMPQTLIFQIFVFFPALHPVVLRETEWYTLQRHCETQTLITLLQFDGRNNIIPSVNHFHLLDSLSHRHIKTHRDTLSKFHWSWTQFFSKLAYLYENALHMNFPDFRKFSV